MAADLHALLVPFAADSHIRASLHVAQALASHGISITFCDPGRAHSLRRNSLPTHPLIRVEVIPDGLPADESQLPSHQQMLASIPIMQNALQLLLEKLSAGPLPISCIISDTFLPWTQDLADKAGIPRIDCWTSNATAYSMGVHLPELISRGYLPIEGSQDHGNVKAPLVDFIPGVPAFPVSELHREFPVEGLSHPKLQFVLGGFSRARDAHAVLVHSLYELESEAVDALKACQIRIYSIGPLFHFDLLKETISRDNASTQRSTDKECLKWLDRQLVASVVYVAFGTVVTLSPEENRELGLGLEASGHPFIWVIRADMIQGGLAATLPEGFLPRVADRCLIVSWAPQREVLKHPSVRAFFTHCGWNSTLESLWAGKPMVACPLQADQMSNARKVVDEWKAGVALEREDNWSFTREAVAEAVKTIMGNSEAEQRAMELKQVVHESVSEGGLSYRNLTDFVRMLKQPGSH